MIRSMLKAFGLLFTFMFFASTLMTINEIPWIHLLFSFLSMGFIVLLAIDFEEKKK